MLNGKIQVGIMGLGQIGRQLYHLALERDDVEIVAGADIGKPEIIEYLLRSDGVDEPSCRLQDNYLINEKFRTRMLQLARPEEVPWDVIGVDCVVDAPRRCRGPNDLRRVADDQRLRAAAANARSKPGRRVRIDDHRARLFERSVAAGLCP